MIVGRPYEIAAVAMPYGYEWVSRFYVCDSDNCYFYKTDREYRRELNQHLTC